MAPFYFVIKIKTELWPSGRRRSLGKRVYPLKGNESSNLSGSASFSCDMAHYKNIWPTFITADFLIFCNNPQVMDRAGSLAFRKAFKFYFDGD